jgi:hypothetical protein
VYVAESTFKKDANAPQDQQTRLIISDDPSRLIGVDNNVYDCLCFEGRGNAEIFTYRSVSYWGHMSDSRFLCHDRDHHRHLGSFVQLAFDHRPRDSRTLLNNIFHRNSELEGQLRYECVKEYLCPVE